MKASKEREAVRPARPFKFRPKGSRFRVIRSRFRVIRGSPWYDLLDYASTAFSLTTSSDLEDTATGFRLVKEIQLP